MAACWHKGQVRGEAAQLRGRTIGLYGGSFNPAHGGHLHVAKEALKRLDLDEIWFLVSPGNPLKADHGMAPFEKRFDSAVTIVGQQPKMRVRQLEKKLGTCYSADTINALKTDLPTTNFIWIMGADNLTNFHLWYRWEFIADSIPIAVFDRTGYALHSLKNNLATKYARYRVAPNKLKTAHTPAWTFVTIPRHTGSATNIRNQHGDNWFANEERK
ncbi:MAG: nicotinate (nicotinamide) nucleotide adenylyltransferase, partial [Kordiimonadaceae bacterium]|nr:nicotinate (nicotinamide) nucleotide adenylyltransferase [Kordiimonadaceae bacterium]